MNITITNFKSIIDSTILQRGRDYFNQGSVVNLEEMDTDRWSAFVDGTYVYEVKVKLENGKIVDSLCTCPYDFGHVCKHEVAAYYAIQKRLTNDDSNTQETAPKKKKSKAKTKRKTVAEKIDEALRQIPTNSLTEIVRDYALEDREFRSMILAQGITDNEVGSKDAYRQIIKESLCSAMDRNGFIDYWSGRQAVRGANELLNQAEQMMEKGRAEQALPIYQAVIEEIVPALQGGDDSNGDFGDPIRYSFEQLHNCVELLKNDKTKKDLFNYCLAQSTHESYDGWTDWQWNFLRLASELISSEEQEKILLDKIEKLCQTKPEDGFSDKYDEERAVELKLEIIKKRGNKEEIEKFITNNLDYTPMRRLALENAFADKDFAKAKELSNKGIEQDQKRGYPGLVSEWLRSLLKIAEREKNINDIRRYCRKLFFSRDGFEYYDQLKKTYAVSEWQEEVKNLLKEIQQKNNWMNTFGTLADIFIREEMWEKLLNLVKNNSSMDTLLSYHQYLAPRFAQELIKMYELEAKDNLAETTGRGHYQEVCRMLRRMKKLGAKERVGKLIEQFSETYKNRRALLDELSRV